MGWMRHPKDVGDRSTLAVMLVLGSQGWPVMLPFGENTRYDLVVDYGSRLSRVQCKTGRLRNGCVLFSTSSTYGHHAPRRPYQGEIDEFAVVLPGPRIGLPHPDQRRRPTESSDVASRSTEERAIEANPLGLQI